MSRLKQVFKGKKNILNIYTVAGYPKIDSLVTIVKELAESGVDIIEIGMPYSDPIADGETIQKASQKAISNGISIDLIFEQVNIIRDTVSTPLLLMGYYNQIIQYGEDRFFMKVKDVKIDGLIIPDLPLNIYQNQYQGKLKSLGIDMVFLITPQTTMERIKIIEQHTSGFLYMVSSYALTGVQTVIRLKQIEYFERVNKLNLITPKLIGFGVSNRNAFNTACKYADGAIIGSAFIKSISTSKNIKKTIREFIKSIK